MTKRIVTLDNEFQAQRIREILDNEGIPHIIRNYHGSAFNGLYQETEGWGAVIADEEYEERIIELFKQL
ncbi:MAG: DUF2007 domain-containing protein [Bacteroidales bacterium]|jgi:hypothetical protein|nr:DUF2007 domain-containing protein [Bacteroidales bacterium]